MSSFPPRLRRHLRMMDNENEIKSEKILKLKEIIGHVDLLTVSQGE